MPETAKRPVWMVWKEGAFSTHWSDPVNTYGPFADEAEAEAFVAKCGGHVYDHANLSFGDREVLGIYD